MITTENKLDIFLSKLDGVKRTGPEQFKAKCPAHNDKHASLSVSTDDKKINFHCHAGCRGDEILNSLGVDWNDIYFDDNSNYRASNKKSKSKRKIVKTYDYNNEQGNLLFQVVRFKPKTFRQRRPDGKGGWVWSLSDVEPVLYQLERLKPAVDNGKVVYYVEGEKDADNLTELGLTTTTNPNGAGKWKDSYTKTLTGANVVIIPDNDKPGKEHAQKVARELKGAASSVKILELPYLKEKQDVTDWLNKGFDKDDLIKRTKNCPIFKPDSQQKEKEFEFESFLPSPIASKIIEVEQNKDNSWKYVAETDLFYFYSNKGYWETQNEIYIRKLIREYLKEINPKWETKHKVSEVLAALKSILLEPENRNLFNAGYNPNTKLINVKTGMIDWKNKKVLDHDPEYYSQFQLPVEYNPEAECINWKQSLKEWVPEKEARMFLQEFVGYSLIPDTSFQKSLILYGTGSNGKSTFLNILIKLFGEENLSSLPLHTLTDRFETVKIQDKLVNICPDISSAYLKETGILKTLIAGEKVKGEFKYGASFSFDPVARLIFSANQLPRSSDQSDAWYRRLEIVKFPNTFSKDDPDFDLHLEDKLKDELPGILNWAIIGLKRLKAQGNFTQSEAIAKAKREYEVDNDNVAAFLEDEAEFPVENYEIASKVYEMYKHYCETNGFKFKSRRQFTSRLKNLGFEITVNWINGKSQRCYKGMILN